MRPPAPDLTVAVQDYLKAIYVLESSGERVTTSALAQRMGVSAPSATAMTKRLDELGLVERLPYRGVALTDDGRRGALEVVRHHRLLERYLVDRLGLSLDEVHAEAELLEHALVGGARGEDRRGARVSDTTTRMATRFRTASSGSCTGRAGRCSTSSRAHADRSHASRTVTRNSSAISASSGSYRTRASRCSRRRRSAAPSPCAPSRASTRSRASSPIASRPA